MKKMKTEMYAMMSKMQIIFLVIFSKKESYSLMVTQEKAKQKSS
jgi:hypothetical protein